MKRLLLGLLFTLPFIGNSIEAQGIWLDAGLNFSYGPTFMLNSDIFSDNSYDHEFSFGNSFGAKIGINYGDFSGLHVVYNSATSTQDFSYILDGVNGQTNEVEWKTHDIMFLYRYSGRGAYLEIGPKYSILNGYSQSINGNDITSISPMNPYDDHISGVLGFGSYIAGSDLVTISLGARVSYAFTDMVSETGKLAKFPTTIVYPLEGDGKTSPFSLLFNLEISYAFGRLAKTSCGGRRKLILFGS